MFSICVFNKKEIIGIGRVIGDSAIYFFIQDVIVKPEYKGNERGGVLMNTIEFIFKKNAKNNSFIGLMAAERVKGFYHKYRYTERPDNGPGMCKMIKK